MEREAWWHKPVHCIVATLCCVVVMLVAAKDPSSDDVVKGGGLGLATMLYGYLIGRK